MTALLSITCATGEMNVYVRGMDGKPKCNAHLEFPLAEWMVGRDDLDPAELDLWRRQNSQPDTPKWFPEDPGPGSPAAGTAGLHKELLAA